MRPRTPYIWLAVIAAAFLTGCPDTSGGDGDQDAMVGDAGETEPTPDMGEPEPAPDMGEPEPTPDMGEPEPTPDMGDDCEPETEICNGEDDDCDGVVDNGFEGLGDACTAGEGACQAEGVVVCSEDGATAVCAAQPGEPADELCNGVDDDCDGAVDNGFEDVGDPCSAGQGACQADGEVVCSEDGATTVCDAEAGEAGEEACNGADDDCDGSTDEGLGGMPCETGAAGICSAGVTACVEGESTCEPSAEPGEEVCDDLDNDCDGEVDNVDALGEACLAGIGACQSAGVVVCTENGPACSAEQGEPQPEVCDGVDNDCNGVVDDVEGVGQPCTAGVGACAAQGVNICGDEGVVCDAVAGAPGPEVCDQIDNDCNGAIDDLEGVGDPCEAGVGACLVQGSVVCTPEGPACDAVPGEGQDELCNAVDDDCDGQVDEGDVCVNPELCDVEGDEDGNGLADCADPACADAPACLVAEDCAVEGDEDENGLADCDDPACADAPQCQPPRQVLLCGASNRDISGIFRPEDNIDFAEGCEPGPNTVGMAISRNGNIDAEQVRLWLEAGGQLLTEFSHTDEIYNAIFGTEWPQGRVTGDCVDNVNPVVRFNEGDPFWALNGGLPLQPENESGCGMDLSGFADPEIVPLGGWSADTISLAYRNIGAGRFYLVEGDWQDGQGEDAAFNDATQQLMRHMLIGAREPVTPIAAPGGRIQLEGALDAEDETWDRPQPNCDADNGDQHPYETHWIVNTTGAPRLVDITATYAGGVNGDGFMHVFALPFDAANLGSCLRGNDDGDAGSANSQLRNVRIESGEILVIVVSTFYGDSAPEDRFIGPFSIEVVTQEAVVEICDAEGDEDGNNIDGCADPACARFPACVEDFNCDDGVDNDLNGDTDCGDPACAAAANCLEAPDNCRDGIDNDVNGQTDCDDAACAEVAACNIDAVCEGIVLPPDPRGFAARDDINSTSWSDGGNDAFDGYGRLFLNDASIDVAQGVRSVEIGGVNYGVLSELVGNVWMVTIDGPADADQVNIRMTGNLGSDGSTEEVRLIGQPGNLEILRTSDNGPNDPPVYTALVPRNGEPVLYERDRDNVTVTVDAVTLPITMVVALSYAEDQQSVADAIATGCGNLELIPGAQQNLAIADVEGRGWQECFRGTYGNSVPGEDPVLADILATCEAEQLMLACRPVAEVADGEPPTPLTLAGEGLREQVVADVGDGVNAVNPHNGLDWYYSTGASWGFAPEGVGVNRNSCDIANDRAEERLCWHTNNDRLDGGWRCGAATGLNGDNQWERIVYQRGRRPAEENCAIPGDEDGNELADCADPACVEAPNCIEAGNCNDGVDNDLDELIDCADPACVEDPICIEAGNCADGVDNDLNEATDCADPVCSEDPVCIEALNCGDRVDNDLNGLTDCEDPACEFDQACVGVPGLIAGVQQDIAEQSLLDRGFARCHRSLYNERDIPLEGDGGVQALCAGTHIAMACRQVAEPANTFALVGEGTFEQVFFNDGDAVDASHQHNGLQWYYSPTSSWGFAPGGEAVNRSSCDVNNPTVPELRMCIHTGAGNIRGGFRCGDNRLNADAGWERIIFSRNAVPLEADPNDPNGADRVPAFGHHGGCNSWNACNDAQTCADAACALNGLGQAIGFEEGNCQDLQRGEVPDIDCNLFSALPDNLDRSWNNGCNIPVVYNVLCTGAGAP